MSQSSPIGKKAQIANPALEPFAFLIGEWRTTGRHPMFAGEALHGRASFSWHEGGAFLIMRAQVDHPKFPDGVAIIGSDETAKTFAMTYFDERGVSRLLEVTVGDRTVTWRHTDPKFSQTLTITADSDDTLVSTGKMSKDGGPWTGDLSQTFQRERSSK